MPSRKLDRSMPLLELRREIVWSAIACHGDSGALAHAPRFDQLAIEWQAVFLRSLLLEEAIVATDQVADRVDDRCDEHVDDFHIEVLRAGHQDRSALVYTLYFSERPSSIKRPVLGPELETLRSWLPLLAVEEEPGLATFHAIFTQDVADAEAAIQAQTSAEELVRRSREVGEVAQFFDRVQRVRDDVFGDLERHRAQHPELRLARDYAGRFFLKTPRPALTDEERRARAEAKAEAKERATADAERKRKLQEQIRAAKRELAKIKR